MGHGDTTEVDAGTAVLAALTSIADRLRELEPAALADEPDAVHQLRTHVRRVRSLLAAIPERKEATCHPVSDVDGGRRGTPAGGRRALWIAAAVALFILLLWWAARAWRAREPLPADEPPTSIGSPPAAAPASPATPA